MSQPAIPTIDVAEAERRLREDPVGPAESFEFENFLIDPAAISGRRAAEHDQVRRLFKS